MAPKPTWRLKLWLFVILLMGIGVYVFYTEIRPTVIFGLRDDYAQAIPYQQVPVGLKSLKAEECGTQGHKKLTQSRP